MRHFDLFWAPEPSSTLQSKQPKKPFSEQGYTAAWRRCGERKFPFWPMKSHSESQHLCVRCAHSAAVNCCTSPLSAEKNGHDVSGKTCSSWVSGRRKVKCLACYWCPSSPSSCCPNVRWLFSRILTSYVGFYVTELENWPCGWFMGCFIQVQEVLFDEPVDGGHHRRWVS